MHLDIIATLAAYFLFSAAVGAMEAPTDVQKGRFYGWLYRFLQRLAANADRLAEARFGRQTGFDPQPGARVSLEASAGALVATSSTDSHTESIRVVSSSGVADSDDDGPDPGDHPAA